MGEVKLSLGPLSPPLAKQLAEQGLRGEDLEHFEIARASITRLYVGQYLTEAETRKARGRLLKRIAALTTEAVPSPAQARGR